MSYNLFSQYVGKNPTKNIGDDTADKIEKAFNKPKGYLDQSDSDAINSLKEEIINLRNSILKLSKSNTTFLIVRTLSYFSKINENPIIISKRWVPVKAYSKMGMDGFFTDMGYEGNGGDGYVPTHSASDRSYGVKGTGDSMYPAIRNGWYVVCDPDAELTPTEFVQVCLKDGRCTIKEFIGIHNNVLHLLAVNGGERLTFDMDEVEVLPRLRILCHLANTNKSILGLFK